MLSGYNRNFFSLRSQPFLLFSSLPPPVSLFFLPSPSPLPRTEGRDFFCWDDLSISECGY